MAVFTTKAGIIATTLKGFSPERITYKTYQYLLQLADQYTATTATDWTSLDGVSAAPTTQDGALDIVATALKALQANDPDTIIESQGDLIVGNGTGEGVKLAIGLANTVLGSNGTDPSWVSSVTNLTLVTPALGTPSALVLTNATGLVNAGVDADAAIAYNKLNLTGSIVNDDITESSIDQSKMNKKSLSMEFASPVLHVDDATTPAAPTGTGGDVNYVICPEEHIVHTAIGTQTDVSLAWTEADRLEITQDTDDNDGCELNLGITSNSQYAFTVGTDNPYIQARFEVADVSGHDEIIVGFRKAEAHQADYDNYDEAVFMNIDAGTIKVGSIVNGGATVETSTTDTITDGQFAVLKVMVNDVQGLASAIALANEIRTDYTAHLADATMHTTAVDAVNTVTAPAATNLTTLITLVTELLTDYDAHEGDSELGAAWLYHPAQETGDDSLASTAAPTDLATCIIRLNDLKAKFNQHENDATSHAVQDQHVVTSTDASRCFFQLGANSTTLAAPSTTDQFYLDDGEVIVPFIRVLNATTGGKVYLQQLKIGNN